MTVYTKSMMESLAEVRGIKAEEVKLDEGKMKELHMYISQGRKVLKVQWALKDLLGLVT